jgi:hypothetical protein
LGVDRPFFDVAAAQQVLVNEALRKIAFEERAKIHDLVMERIDTVLRRRGYPSVESLKAGKKA